MSTSVMRNGRRQYSVIRGTEKWCNTCKTWRPLSAFGPDTSKPSELKSNCQKCCNRSWRRWKLRKVMKNRAAWAAGKAAGR